MFKIIAELRRELVVDAALIVAEIFLASHQDKTDGNI